MASFSGASREAEAGRAHADLGGGLLAGDVDGGRAAGGEGGGGLEQEGGLADAGIAADEDGRGGDEAAAEHAVEFAEAREGARQRRLGGGEVAERDAPAAGGPEGARGGAGGEAGLLGDGVPGAAGVAAAGPLGVGGAAFGADEGGAAAAHGRDRTSNRQERRTASRRFVDWSARARRPRGVRPGRALVIRVRLPGWCV